LPVQGDAALWASYRAAMLNSLGAISEPSWRFCRSRRGRLRRRAAAHWPQSALTSTSDRRSRGQHGHCRRERARPRHGGLAAERRISGPDFHQMEPTDQLDASNRRLPESRVRRFAKRKSASRTSSIFLANPSVSLGSSIRRFGCCWLRRACFGTSEGQSWGQFPTRNSHLHASRTPHLQRLDTPGLG
jgi:hypothetical protein